MNTQKINISKLRLNLATAGISASFKIQGKNLELRLADEAQYPDLCDVIATEVDSDYILTVRFGAEHAPRGRENRATYFAETFQ